MKAAITAEHLKKYYRDVKAVDDISFSVEQGELFGFLGVNGAGKSTLMKCLFGIYHRDEGEDDNVLSCESCFGECRLQGRACGNYRNDNWGLAYSGWQYDAGILSFAGIFQQNGGGGLPCSRNGGFFTGAYAPQDRWFYI